MKVGSAFGGTIRIGDVGKILVVSPRSGICFDGIDGLRWLRSLIRSRSGRWLKISFFSSRLSRMKFECIDESVGVDISDPWVHWFSWDNELTLTWTLWVKQFESKKNRLIFFLHQIKYFILFFYLMILVVH